MVDPVPSFDSRRMPGASVIAFTCFAVLYVPMFILVVNSFNSGNSIGHWEGISLRWYVAAFSNLNFREAALNSLVLATTAAIISTIAAAMAALATARGQSFRGEKSIYAILNQPLAVPEIVIAISLLIVVAQLKVWTGYSGLLWLLLAHVAFCIPFAYMPIRARLEGMDNTLETAAADLYGSRFYIFRRITLPLMAPGALAGFMLAFVISLDNVVISDFLKSPGQDTLPTYLMAELRRNLSSEIYAISSILLLASVLSVVGSWVMTRRKD